MSVRLGVSLGGHWLPLDATLRLAHEAEAAGFELVLVDGDATRIPARPRSPLYDGPVVCGAVLSRTRRIRAGAIALPGFRNAAVLARELATLAASSDGRAVGLFGAGAGRHWAALGLPHRSAAERRCALGETVDAVRRLLAGGEVTVRGRFVSLDAVTAPAPRHPVPLVVAARRPGSIGLASRLGDVWDANVPPVPRLLDPLRRHLARPIETWIWVFARPRRSADEAYAEYRRLCPWFPVLAPAERNVAVLSGDPAGWREQLVGLREALGVTLLVLDLCALGERDARDAIRSQAGSGTIA